jgi:hypothetical protein
VSNRELLDAALAISDPAERAAYRHRIPPRQRKLS